MTWLRNLKEYSGLIAVGISVLFGVLNFLYTYSLDKERSRAIFTASCYPVFGGKIAVDLSDSRYLVVGFETKCAVRNLGYRPADIVEVRNAIMYDTDVQWRPMQHQPPERWEVVSELRVNGKRFEGPVNVPPGSQASVDLMLGVPVIDKRYPTALQKCGLREVVNRDALDTCLHKHGLLWTDYLQTASLNLDPFGWDFNGVAALFMLSDGTYVLGEVQFRVGTWNCKLPGGRLPHYMRDLCKDTKPVIGG